MYDGKAEVLVLQDDTDDTSNIKWYRASKSVMTSTGYSQMPCGICPVS